MGGAGILRRLFLYAGYSARTWYFVLPRRKRQERVTMMNKPLAARVMLCALALSLLLGLAACSSKTTESIPKSSTLSGIKVHYSAPPSASWTESVQQLPRATASASPVANQQTDTLIRYTPTWANSFLTISALGNWEFASWEEDPEKTNDLVRSLQDQILKRTDGKIVEQKQTTLGKETALLLNFTYLEATTPMHGMQVFAIHDKTFISIALTCPEANYKDSEPVFNTIMTSFRFE